MRNRKSFVSAAAAIYVGMSNTVREMGARRPFHTVMHELSIMQSALSQVLEEAQRAGASRVHEVRLRIGALSGVVPDALQFAFEALSEGTPAENATLTIEQVPARFWCDTCRREFESDRMFADCPDCGVPSADLRGGRELELTSLEIA